MPSASPRNRTRVFLAVLAGACVVVGMLWALRWAFEGRVLEGHLSPDAALAAMAGFVTMLQALAAAVAALLATLLAWIARRTRETRRWPPSGQWPTPRGLDATEAHRCVRWLHAGAGAAGALAVAALAAALL